MEDIDGEVLPSAGLTEPDFSQFGPVEGHLSTRPTAADQSPSLDATPGTTVLSETQALPNQYEGEFMQPDWLGKDTSEGLGSSRRPMTQSSPPQRMVKPTLSAPRLQIDGMKAIESANRDFDSRTHEIIRERYPDGSIKIVRTIAQDADGNYYNDGGWLMYDRQQRPIASGTFVRGAMEGDWERVHEPGSGGLFSQMPFNLFEGPYLSRANFVRNEIDGVWTITDKSENLICSITFENGVRNGLASWFYPGGKKMREATFKQGVPHGIVLQWDQQGKMQRREQFVDGRKVIRKKSTYSNQTLASERVFRDQKLTPQVADNWWTAKPATFDREGEEVQHGPVAEWYPNRQPKMTGRYVDGVRDGLFTWWHETHNKKAEGEFAKGKRTGLWRYWHESGMKRSEGRFEEDRPVGVWRIWNENGKVVDEKTFDAQDTATESRNDDESTSDAEMETPRAAKREETEEPAGSETVLEQPDGTPEDFSLDIEDAPETQDPDVDKLERIEGEPVPSSDDAQRDPGSITGG